MMEVWERAHAVTTVMVVVAATVMMMMMMMIGAANRCYLSAHHGTGNAQYNHKCCTRLRDSLVITMNDDDSAKE